MTPRTLRTPDTDHDLLIRIDTKVEGLASSVMQMQSAFEGRVARLEVEKASSSDLDVLRSFIEKTQEKNRTDIDWTKRMIWMGLGAIVAVQALGGILLAIYLKH
jgi:hypothetical protein